MMSTTAYEKIFAANQISKAIIGDQVRTVRNLWRSHLTRTDLDRWVFWDKSVASFDEIPAEVQEEIKAELLKWMVSGEDTIAFATLSESSLCGQLQKWQPMLTNQTKKQ